MCQIMRVKCQNASAVSQTATPTLNTQTIFSELLFTDKPTVFSTFLRSYILDSRSFTTCHILELEVETKSLPPLVASIHDCDVDVDVLSRAVYLFQNDI